MAIASNYPTYKKYGQYRSVAYRTFVQRKPVEEPQTQTPFKVELKHHEFEKPPQTEEVTWGDYILLLEANHS